MFAVDRWAEAFISASAGKSVLRSLDEREYVAVQEGLVLLRTALKLFYKKFRYESGTYAASKMISITKDALKKCGYEEGSNRGVEAALSVLFLIIKKNRVIYGEKFCCAADSRSRTLAGILTVTLESAREPDEAFLRDLKSALSRKTGARIVEIIQKTDPALIGGRRLSIGTERLDCSLAGAMRRMRDFLEKTV
ncbi:MAG: F0F1 ATP synthase subunit delta [Spirochaetaceae bacterium]|jgi:F0F1-type ATP synthase delta subunit|nr:F0F1 ATP synthase subunit delta [Spirochaetaceae bacterium]